MNALNKSLLSLLSLLLLAGCVQLERSEAPPPQLRSCLAEPDSAQPPRAAPPAPDGRLRLGVEAKAAQYADAARPKWEPSPEEAAALRAQLLTEP